MQNFIALTLLFKNLEIYRTLVSNLGTFQYIVFLTWLVIHQKKLDATKIANFTGYFLRNGQKDYFFLLKIFELLPAKLNFSRIPEDFQIYRMVYI